MPFRTVSLHDQVAERLRSQIFDRQLAPGDFIDENAFAERWQISRTPLREALKVLVSEGLVEPVPRRGCRVIEMTATDADELFPIMAMLEGRCAFEATQRATDADLRELRRLHDELERTASAHDVDGYYRANHEFHSYVQRLAGNRWLDRVTADLRKFVRMLRGRQLVLPGRIDASINEHRVLIAAIFERDAARAERAMHDHLLAQHAALKTLRRIESGDSTNASPREASNA
ncbi:MAG: GntR family transcriptional regulator [Burkholderiales bacterium]|nr:GntR family transcriptional regulator [Burkholderiales bacterium]